MGVYIYTPITTCTDTTFFRYPFEGAMKWKVFQRKLAGGQVIAFAVPDFVEEEAYFAQPYIRKQLAFLEEKPERIEAFRKKVIRFDSYHDDSCGFYRSPPTLCDCDADVQIREL